MKMIKKRIANGLFKAFLFLTCKIDLSEFKKIPWEGPGIFVTNHTTNIEAPMYYVTLFPRRMTALGKSELWKNPLTRFFMNAWEVIPLHRGAGDRDAIRNGLEALESGMFLGIAPEGTRSKTGVLMKGHRGASFFATVKRVPIYPIATWGIRDWPKYLLKPKRCPVSVRVGEPFFLEKKEPGEISSQDRRKMTDQMMYRIASLLPEELRGPYADLNEMDDSYITPVNT